MKGKNNIIILVVVALIVGAGAFFAGMQYQQKTQSVAGISGKMQVMGRNGTSQARGGAQGMTPVNGEIISQDDTSITVKMDDGSSKIIILSDKTTINKTSEGSQTDLKTGEKITAFGTTNADGSVTAQTVSIGGTMFRVMPQDGEKPTGQPAN